MPDDEDDNNGVKAKSLAQSRKGSRSNRSNSEILSPGRRSSTSTRKDSETPSLTQEKSPESSTDGSSVAFSGTFSNTWTSSTSRRNSEEASDKRGAGKVKALDWSHLPKDLQFYLDYHQKHLNHYTYSFRHDAGPFLRTTLLAMALRHKPLLYAVVGFSAFQHALTKPDSKLQDFLGYYTTAMSNLRLSLGSNQKHSVATLLTILQLATIEVRASLS